VVVGNTCRLTLSDGTKYMQAMLATQKNQVLACAV
jgi:hypothetical protein